MLKFFFHYVARQSKLISFLDFVSTTSVASRLASTFGISNADSMTGIVFLQSFSESIENVDHCNVELKHRHDGN